ncbi:MAG: hypothetical protein K6E19_02895, partial [Lachnospiraceae bacterium]|nr:hypothetical protein [Lachnospiraceae bacterium]
MRKMFAAFLVSALFVTEACGSNTPSVKTDTSVGLISITEDGKASVSVADTGTEIGSETSNGEASSETAEWRFELDKDYYSNEYKNDSDQLLARIFYSYPVLKAVCNDDTAEVPSDMQKKLDAFNAGIKEYIDSLPTIESLSEDAVLFYNEVGEDSDYRKNFPVFTSEVSVSNLNITREL